VFISGVSSGIDDQYWLDATTITGHFESHSVLEVPLGVGRSSPLISFISSGRHAIGDWQMIPLFYLHYTSRRSPHQIQLVSSERRKSSPKFIYTLKRPTSKNKSWRCVPSGGEMLRHQGRGTGYMPLITIIWAQLCLYEPTRPFLPRK
jgi:hypothetical protein